MNKEEKALEIIKRLYKLWPHPTTELIYSNNLELLISVILSAQTTDKVVNKVTPGLFIEFNQISNLTKNFLPEQRLAFNLANSDIKKIDSLIKSVNFHNMKSKHIRDTASIIYYKYKGHVPGNLNDLISLPGVARKTANVVLSIGFQKYEGIAVDTHVKRLAKCLKLTSSDNVSKIEEDLMNIVPRKYWGDFSNLLILYGRYYCPASKSCKDCPILGDLSI